MSRFDRFIAPPAIVRQIERPTDPIMSPAPARRAAWLLSLLAKLKRIVREGGHDLL